MSRRARNPFRSSDDRYSFPHLLMIAASAGTGKTHQLAKRYVQFILDTESSTPHNDISNILAITFTRKAAREMKERVLDHLKKIALGGDKELLEELGELVQRRSAELPLIAAERTSQVIDRYTDFQVQTIDSFMNRIARSCALELDLAPDIEPTTSFEELGDYALSLLLNRVGPGRDPDTTRLLEDFLSVLNRAGGGRFVWNPESELLKTFSKLSNIEAKETGRLVFEDTSRSLEENLKLIRRVYAEVTKPPLSKNPRKGFEEALEAGDIPNIVDRYNPSKPPVYKTGAQAAVYEKRMNQWGCLAQAVDDLSVAHALSVYQPYARVYDRFTANMEAARNRTGTIALSDMTKKLNQFIRTDIIPDIYLRLGQRLYHFLIDEFQDTNPVQWQNIDPLVVESLSKDGSLFLVGDLKQAIYMFRSADYKIMRKLLREIEGESTDQPWLPPSVRDSSYVRPLTVNYRSGEIILKYVDHLFKNKLRSLLGTPSFQEDLTRLTDFELEPSEDNKGKGYVEVIQFQKDAEEPDAPSPREVLLKIIQDLRRRNYDYGDIAILTGKNYQLEETLDWLTAADVPATASSSVDIRKRRAVNEVIELLKFLDSPVNNLAFTSFITGDIMARVSVEMGVEFGADEFCELALAAQSGGSEYLYQKFKSSPSTERLWEECFEDLYQKTGYYPLYDLLTLALRTFRVFENFPEESGSLARLLEAVNSLGASGKNSIQDFLAQAGEQGSEMFDLELPEYTNAVKLLTYHKSKGLGFPVVINLLYESGGGTDNICYDKKGEELEIYYITKKTRKNSSLLQRIWVDRSVDDQIQWLNALYVTMTRAEREMYNLVMPGKKGSLYAFLFEECRLGQKTDLPEGEKTSMPGPLPVRLGERPVALPDSEGSDAWYYERWVETKRGEVYHEILGQIEFIEEDPGEEIGRVLARKWSGLLPVADAETVRNHLVQFLSHPEARGWFQTGASRKIFREQDFVDSSGRLHRMDRVIVDTDRVIVVDFKTGEPKDYSKQLNDYASLLGLLYSGRRIEAYLAYVDTAQIERVL